MKNSLFFCFFAFLFVPVFGQIEISNIQIQQQGENALRYDVSFQTSKICNAYVAYSDNQITRYTNVSKQSNTHHITVIGLHSQANYNFTIHVFDSTGLFSSTPKAVTTGSVPGDIAHAIDSVYNDTSATEGYVLANARGSVRDQYRIFDRSGKLVWYDYMNLPGAPCIGYRFTERNTILQVFGDCQTVLERSLEGDTLLRISLANLPMELYAHHDFFFNDRGNIVILVGEGRVIDKTSVGGPADAIVVADGFVEMTPEGDLVQYWTPFDHFDPVASENFGSFWDPIFGEKAEDWQHANSLSQDVDGHYLFSFNAFDQIVKIHRETGEIIWTLGKDGDFTFDPPLSAFAKQHAFHSLGTNRYLVFDNQGGKTFSRASEFVLDLENKIAHQVFVQDADSTLITGIVGSAYRLPNGNTLTCFGRLGVLQEVDATGKTVWYRSEGLILNYRAFFVPYFYEPIPEIQLLDTVFCAGASPMLPQTSLNGGFFSGEGTIDGKLHPKLLDPGFHKIVYNYAWQKDTFDIEIQEIPSTPQIQQTDNLLFTQSPGNFQWLLNGQPIEGATNDTLEVSISGSYQLQVTNDAGCSNISASVEVMLTNTEDLAGMSFKLFPNPSDGQIYLTWEARQVSELQVEVYSTIGQKLRQFQWTQPANTVKLDLQNLQKGMYWVKIRVKDQVMMRPIFIK